MRLKPVVLLALAASWAASGQSYTISTFAGGALPINIPGTLASVVPVSVVADQTGNLFFAAVNSVLRFNATTGIVTLVAGNGTTGFSGDNGPATSAPVELSPVTPLATCTSPTPIVTASARSRTE
jgi:hypothetical protein